LSPFQALTLAKIKFTTMTAVMVGTSVRIVREEEEETG
jgi:hypothetical protein